MAKTSSEWTLDYPPFFAYFEFLLSLPASLIDPGIVDIQNLGYFNFPTLAFQRLSVILSELILYYAIQR